MITSTKISRKKPKLAFASVGLFCLVISVACSSTKQNLSATEVIERIAKNECATLDLVDSPLLVGLWSATGTTYISYPTAELEGLRPETPVQLGGLTTSFLVPRMLVELDKLGLTLDSTAIPVRDDYGNSIRNITFGQLLLHHSDLPVYQPGPDGESIDHLLTIDRLLRQQKQEEVKNKYHFDHWNYTLAAEAISSKASGIPNFRVKQLAYTDQLPDSVFNALAVSKAKVTTPQEKQHPDLFALSTAGIASANQLSRLLDSLSLTDLTAFPRMETQTDRPNTSIIPGWHVLELNSGELIYINSGQTRRHGAAVAYYPYTNTGVVAVAADSKRLDCLVVDILRNLNNNWKRQPTDEQK